MNLNSLKLPVLFSSLALFAVFPANSQVISSGALKQIEALQAEKESRTPAQQKMDSQLVYAAQKATFGIASAAAPQLQADVKLAEDGSVAVDISANVSDDLLKAIEAAGGTIINSFPDSGAIRATLPPANIEPLAGRSDVRFIEPAVELILNTGTVTGQGDTTHRAAAVRTAFGLTGAGVSIGVLSDSVDFLANSQALGDIITTNTTVLTGQNGVNTCGSSGTNACTGEGTAMLEILSDLVPAAKLFFATANGGTAAMSNNIIALRAAGCKIIVDDVTYANESPFQDGPIAQAVNNVSAAGVLYFSSAANSGNVTHNTSGTWEGDFADAGATTIGRGGRLHTFGASSLNTATLPGRTNRVDLFWADPLNGTTNDYDVYVLDPTGTTVRRAGNTPQTGTQPPYEFTTVTNGETIAIVRFSGASRFLHLDANRSRLSIGTTGSTRGHNASGAANAFSVAATPAATAFNGISPVGPFPNPFTGGATDPIENFSSDGPRRIFFNANGTPITPGNFSATGGQVLQKPDITAADGVSSSAAVSVGCPNANTCFNPFFGTSAAAPHAAAIAALLLSSNPVLTPAQIRTALTTTALDIEAAGVDRDSGFGIVMPFAALKFLNPCTITCPANIVRGNDPGVCGAIVTFAPATNGGCGLSVSCSPPSGSLFSVGTTTVTCTSASEDSCSFTITIKDTEKPRINCPGSVTQCNDPGQCSALVAFTVSATDNCPGVGLVCVPPPGSIFPVGSTTVNCAATDTATNTSTCSFPVVVKDCEPPIAACRPAVNPSGKKIPTAGKNPASGQNPDGYYQLLAKDNCDPDPKIYVQDSDSGFVAGPFHNGDVVKITQSHKPSSQGAPDPVVAHLHLKGDALVYAVDVTGNIGVAVSCNVPPPPK